jgi:hypothetical protein
MNGYPLSCFSDVAKTTAGGVLSFYAGLVGGSIIVFSEMLFTVRIWGWCLVAWLALIPYTIAKLWGLILAPILGVMLIGSIWLEWNRLIIASLVAISLSITTLYCAKHNPLAESESALPFIVTMGLALSILAIGVIWEIIQRHPPRKRRGPPQSVASPEPRRTPSQPIDLRER